jgi:NAD(P)-dependent dehydrogenase (short-subunit alcohol dehydrogenase family)
MTRVLIVGGAGVFGRRLAEGLLATTDAHVLIAGRSLERARRAARQIGAHEAHALDRRTVSAEALRALAPDLVIDAAGPFQGADLSFARAALDAGAHYLDLADARDFVAAFPSLDAFAKARGRAAITGASSTPALTHAVLDELRAGWRRIDVVRAGIAPANQAPRGPSLVKAILLWAGRPIRVFERGAWRTRPGWSNCGVVDIKGLGPRRFAVAETPDLDLIPRRFAPTDSALFMAGLELPIMQRGIEAVGALRRWGLLPHPEWFADLLAAMADQLLPFGTDRGAMVVEVFGRDAEDRPARACWTMIAPDGLGPYTPTFPALAIARRIIANDAPPRGAYPCIGVLRLADIEPEFSRYGFSTAVETEPLRSPFEAALGDAFDNIPPAVRASHRGGPVTRLCGEAQVRGATAPVAKFIAGLFGLPRTSAQTPVAVAKRLGSGGVEEWERDFGGRRMKSRLRALGPGRVRESFGPFHFDLAVSADAKGIAMQVVAWRLGLLALPSALAPRSVATEGQDAAGRFCFDVPVELPLLGRVTHYSGWLAIERVEATPACVEKEGA